MLICWLLHMHAFVYTYMMITLPYMLASVNAYIWKLASLYARIQNHTYMKSNFYKCAYTEASINVHIWKETSVYVHLRKFYSVYAHIRKHTYTEVNFHKCAFTEGCLHKCEYTKLGFCICTLSYMCIC
jgi:hypothetical protein